jgi:hypothetical protein
MKSFLPVAGDAPDATAIPGDSNNLTSATQACIEVITPVPEPGDAASGMFLCLHQS